MSDSQPHGHDTPPATTPPSRFSPVEHHPPLEEYLQAIETLHEDGVAVIQARIAERLGVTAPSVSEMVDRLAADGYVERSAGNISLTERGKAVAHTVIRRHRLAERLLVDVIGLPWHLIHDEAGRWEHVISADVEAKLVDLLGDPGTCPHGNPIPGSANWPGTPTTQFRLSDFGPGETLRFERLGEDVEFDRPALEYLDDAGFIPGTTARVTGKSPDGALVLEVSDRTVVLGRGLCQRLFAVAA